MTVSRWGGLHFRQAREIPVRVFCVQREGAKDSKRDPRESWFVCIALCGVDLAFGRCKAMLNTEREWLSVTIAPVIEKR